MIQRTVTDDEANEISSKTIISANSILNRFKYIFEPLIEIAQNNYRSLSSKITSLQEDYNAEISNYYSFGNSVTEISTKFRDLTNNFINLENSWNDIDSYDPMTHTDPSAWAATHPLHVEKNGTIFPASGKVRPYDFIAAYNFKGFVESLYAIAAEMRNISFNVYVNNILMGDCNVGKKNKYDSYKDLNNINSSTVTDRNLFPDDNNRATFSFNDYIINTNANGKQIFTYDELINPEIMNDPISATIFHGYVGDETLVPLDISSDVIGNNKYLNANYISELSSDFGRQTVNHFQAQQSLPIDLSAYYNYPPRYISQGAKDFDYTSEISSGIAYEYKRLKPAYTCANINLENLDSFNPKTILGNWKEISSELSSIFSPLSTLPNTPNKIVSKTKYLPNTTGQIISAQTVNDMFRILNKAAATISSILCGVYNIRLEWGAIDEDLPPKSGLGYPEFFSWYYGTTHDNQLLCNQRPAVSNESNEWGTNITTYHNGNDDSLRRRENNFCNGNLLATEDHTRNKPIRAGLFYYDSISAIDISAMKDLAKFSHSSFVPMACNKYKIFKTGNNNNVCEDYEGGTITDNNFKGEMLKNVKNTLPNNNTVLIEKQAIIGSSKRQLFNRYNISRPYRIKQYYQDISSTLPDYNVNTKFIFMPYMTWLNTVLNNEMVIYNGEISSSSGNYITSKITSLPKYINPAAGIPVLYENRINLWNRHEISACAVIPSENNYNCIGDNSNRFGTVQLELTYPYPYSESSQIDSISNARKINTIEYNLRAAATVNEVNHTHRGYTKTTFFTGKNISTIITTDYSWHSNDGTVNKKILEHSNKDISSKIYIGLNSYANSNAETSCYIKDSTGDMMRMLFGNRFKFNDFYRDYNPLANNNLQRKDVAPYFTPGGSNNYVEGNATQVMSWVTEISNDVSSTNFIVNHIYYQETGESKSGDEVMSPNLLQGNFFFSGNHSNKLNAEFNSTDKDCTYRFVPQPDPITANIVNINPTNGPNFGHFTMRGTCNHFWNNVAEVDINLKHGTNTTEIVLKSVEEFQDNHGTNRPYNNVQPELSSYLIRDGDTSRINVGKIKFNSTNNTFEVQIEVDLTTEELNDLSITNPLSDDVSCTMRFINENSGFRDVCRSKSSSLKTDGYFKLKKLNINPLSIN